MEQKYVGSELEVFAGARNWKGYYATHLKPYIQGDVLEVGAGIGGTTPWLRSGRETSWVCLEPDSNLLDEAKVAFARESVRPVPELIVGDVTTLAPARRFDCILYIDVLEHIPDDRSELRKAADHLNPGGSLVVLSPAHDLLFSEFDRQIGHYRRYTKSSLQAAVPPDMSRVTLFYLDAVGVLLSFANRALLRSGQPTSTQVNFWDRFVIPISRIVDPCLGWRVGKTIIGVWTRSSAPCR